MKILITFLLVAFSSVAFGKEICTEVPEGTKFDDVKVNFDGSKIYINPQLYVEGEYAQVFASETSALGLCEGVLKMNYVAHEEASANELLEFAALTKDGEFTGLFLNRYYVTQVHCR